MQNVLNHKNMYFGMISFYFGFNLSQRDHNKSMDKTYIIFIHNRATKRGGRPEGGGVELLNHKEKHCFLSKKFFSKKWIENMN